MLLKFPRATPACEHNKVTLIAIIQISQAQIRVLVQGFIPQEFGEVYWRCLPHASLGATVLDMCPGVTAEALALSQFHTLERSMLTLVEPSAGGP